MEGHYKEPKAERKREFLLLFEKARFSYENKKERFGMLNNWSREPLGEKRNPKAEKEGVRLSICVSDKTRFDMISELLFTFILFCVCLQLMNKCWK